MNTRSRRRVTITGSNHPFIKEMMGSEDVITKRQVFHEFPRESSVHAGKFAEVHFARKPSNIQNVVSPLSSLRTPRKGLGESSYVTPDQKNRKNYRSSQVHTPNALHFLARSPNCALKIQRIADPRDFHDKAYHEVLIHKSLAQTAGGCPGFTMLHSWFKSYEPSKNSKKPINHKNSENLKKILFNTEEEEEEEEDDEDEQDDEDEENKEYFMNFVLERADVTLDSFLRKKKIISQQTFQNILFQLLFSLQIMQRECGFVHHDLHKKNILLKKLDPETILKFRLTEGTEWLVKDNLVKITDFGHSRVEMSSGHIIYNTSRPCTAIFDASKDIMMIRSNFRGCKIRWSDKKTKDMKNSLWRQMGKVRVTEDVRNLLSHPFFNKLRCFEETNNIKNFEMSNKMSNVILFEERSKWRRRRKSKKKKKKKNKKKKKKKKKNSSSSSSAEFRNTGSFEFGEEEELNIKNHKNITGRKRKLYDEELDFERCEKKRRKLDHIVT